MLSMKDERLYLQALETLSDEHLKAVLKKVNYLITEEDEASQLLTDVSEAIAYEKPETEELKQKAREKLNERS